MPERTLSVGSSAPGSWPALNLSMTSRTGPEQPGITPMPAAESVSCALGPQLPVRTNLASLAAMSCAD